MSTELPWDACPTCGYAFDRASHAKGPVPDTSMTYPGDERVDHYKAEPAPTPGDFSICFNCGELLTYDTGLRTIVAPAERLADLNPKQRRQVAAARAAIRERGPLPDRERIVG